MLFGLYQPWLLFLICLFTILCNGDAEKEVFWNNNWPSDTDGDLSGTVLFAQAQIVPSHYRVSGDDMQPHLTASRTTLVMFQPKSPEEVQSIQMTARNAAEDTVLGTLTMNPPEDIPKQDGWFPISEEPTFPDISSKTPYVIQGKSNLNELRDDPNYLRDKLISATSDGSVEIKLWDGSWISDVDLPDATGVPSESVVFVTSNAGYKVRVNYPNTVTGGMRTRTLSRNDRLTLVISEECGCWVSPLDLEHNEYIFGNNFWTAVIDPEWVQPGLIIDLEDNNGKIGSLVDIHVGAFTELIITTIDAGFLTEPRGEFTFQDDITAHREYFQTTPASRMVVAPYEPLHLTEVMLPTGTLYTSVSDDNGGWHSGDMRQYIGKILLSHGIDLANYGINSSSGTSPQAHPFTCALLAGHNTVGMYQNGRIVHGGSGGNGMITLDSSDGNEMSHEAGHNYGLGHYVRGFTGSVHRAADQTGSTWGWDSDLNVFIPNFDSSNTGEDMCCCPSNENDECESPFLGKYQYGKDSMAGGGGGKWGSNRYTLYTPNSMSVIQDFFEAKAIFDPSSSTGFRKYNPTTHEMEEFNTGHVPRLFRVPVTTLVGYYDPKGKLTDYIYPALHGSFGFVYDDDASESSGTGCELHVQTSEGERIFQLSSSRETSNVMNKFHVNIAAEEVPSRAEIYCNSQLRVAKDLNGPQKELQYTVHGKPFSKEDPVPTSTPSRSPTDSPSVATPTACSGTSIDILIMTDSNPEQNRVTLVDRTNKDLLYKTNFGDYSSPNTLYTKNICSPDSCFSLKVQDKGKNGLGGGGYYSLVVDGETLVDQHSDIGKLEKTEFCTPLPTSAPTAAPVPTTPTTPAPAPSGCSVCGDGDACIQLSIMTDSNPRETRVKIKDNKNKEWVMKTNYGDYSTPNTLYTETICHEDSCFGMFVEDKGKNGFQGGGYYSLVVDGETLVDQKSDFGKNDKMSFCTPSSPSPPVPAPTPSPGGCEDESSFQFKGKTRDCSWVASKLKRCKKLSEYCPVTCGSC